MQKRYNDEVIYEGVVRFLTKASQIFWPKTNVLLKDDDYIVPASENRAIYHIATDAKTFTLPAGVVGLKYKFVNTGADDALALIVAPKTGDYLFGTVMAVSLSGTVSKHVINTKSGANKGDYIELECLETGKWYITSGIGVWASES